MIPDEIMIFAAGFGTRMMPLTRDIPKPMVKLDGKPMIDLAIDLANQVDTKNIVTNLHYKADILLEHLKETGVTSVLEEPDILDTGGGLKNAAFAFKNDPVWTLNCDAVWNGPNPLKELLDHWNSSRMDALVLCVEPERAKGTDSSGDFSLSDRGTIARGTGVIYGGAQIIKMSRVVEEQDHVFSLNKVWDTLIAEGRCHGCIYPGEWCDIGTPAGLETASQLLAAQHDGE